MVSPAQIRAEQPQRKRPKYTRSKTGCLTCRAKKIKVRGPAHFAEPPSVVLGHFNVPSMRLRLEKVGSESRGKMRDPEIFEARWKSVAASISPVM